MEASERREALQADRGAPPVCLLSTRSVCKGKRHSASLVPVQLPLQSLAVARHGEAEYEIDDPDHNVDLQAESLPRRLDDGCLAGRQQIEDADDEDEACILEKPDERIDERRNDEAQRLRQDDKTGLLPVGEAQRVGRLVLALRKRLQAAAHYLRQIGAGKENDRDLRAQQLVDVDPLRK